jgi:tetratricopeptide (TPR) repeat protein
LVEINNRPLYTNFAVTKKDNNLGLYSISDGYTHRIYKNIDEAKSAKKNEYYPSIRNLSSINEQSDYPLAGLASHYYYNLAHLYLTLGKKDDSQKYLIKAFNLDIAPFNHEYRRFIEYRLEWLGNK